jgi:enamine deaminase RidA (YjgF/YER057c/UK114 family)
LGDFIFIPGIASMAAPDEPQRNAVAAGALMPEGLQWAGQPIKLETEFIITQRIVPSLKLAGAGLDDVVHAQIYLTDPEDYSAFNEVWSRYFGPSGCNATLRPVRAPQAFAAPTVSAMTAPRVPSGLSGPTVESRAVWCSISELSSAPTSATMVDSHIHIINPTTAPSAP